MKIRDMILRLKNTKELLIIWKILTPFFLYSGALLFGMILGFYLFFPSKYLVNKINTLLNKKGYKLSGDFSYSFPLAIEGENIVVKRIRGGDLITFSELTFTPSIFALLSGNIDGDLEVEGINGRKGYGNILIENNGKCYYFDLTSIPLTFINDMSNYITIRGFANLKGKLCFIKKKLNGKITLTGNDLFVKIPMLDKKNTFHLTDMSINAQIKKNRLVLKKSEVKGDINLKLAGKVYLRTMSLKSSRLDLSVKMSFSDKLKKNLSLIDVFLGRYKSKKKGEYSFRITGLLSHLSLRR